MCPVLHSLLFLYIVLFIVKNTTQSAQEILIYTFESETVLDNIVINTSPDISSPKDTLSLRRFHYP